MSIAPKIKVTLDRERTLWFSYNAFIALEEATGHSIMAGIDPKVFQSARGIRDFLWAGLLHEDPTLTREQVGEMLSFDRIAEIVETVAAALAESMPKPKAGKKAPPPKASR